MKKLITIMLVVVLSCSSVIVAYADTTENAFDWTTAEFKFTYDDTNFYHHSDGTCDILNADGSVAYTMNKEETASKFKALKISFDSAGNIKVEQGMLYGMACGISDILGIAGSFLRATPITDRLGDLLVSSTSHSFTYEYMTNNLNKDAASVSSDGTLSLTQKGVQDIYNLLMKQYMESHGMYDWYPSQYHSDDVSIIYNFAFERVANVMWNFGGTSVSKETAYAYMRTLCQTMIKDGCTFISLDQRPNCSAEGKTGDTDKWYIYFVNRDNFDNAAYVDGGGYYGNNKYIYFYDYEGNPLDSVIACVDLIDFFNNYDSSQDVNDYVFYTNKRHSYVSPINWSQDGASLFVYQSAEKMYKDLDGGATDYITSDFASGNIPSSITLSPDMLSQDWDKFTDELTDAITDALKGADSSEKQDKIDETFQRYLKKINSNIEDLNADNNKLTKKSNKLLDDILDKVKDINKDTNKYLKGIQKDYLKDIKSYCKDMKKSMSDILKNVKTIKHIEELNLLITALSDSDRDKALSDIKTDSKQVQSVLHRKFPTCVFNDAKQIFDLLSATPVAPVVTMRVGFESVGVSDVLTMDFHIFDDYIGQFRQLQELIYIFVLFRATRKMFVDGGDL